MKFWSRIRLNLAFFVDFLIIITNPASCRVLFYVKYCYCRAL